VAVFENRQPVTAAKFINKSPLFIQLPGVIRRLELKLISEQKAENIFVAPPYCQAACCTKPSVVWKPLIIVRGFCFAGLFMQKIFRCKTNKLPAFVVRLKIM